MPPAAVAQACSKLHKLSNMDSSVLDSPFLSTLGSACTTLESGIPHFPSAAKAALEQLALRLPALQELTVNSCEPMELCRAHALCQCITNIQVSSAGSNSRTAQVEAHEWVREI